MLSNHDKNLNLFDFIEVYANAFTKFIRIYDIHEKDYHRAMLMENTWAGHMIKYDLNKVVIPPVEASYFAKMNDTDEFAHANESEHKEIIDGIFANLDISIKAIFDVSKISSRKILGGFDKSEVIGIMPSTVIDPYDGASIPVLDIFII